MAKSDRFVAQHDGILAAVKGVRDLLSVTTLATNATPIVLKLANLSGKVKMHLAAEDQALYPRLLEKGNDVTKQTTKRFSLEMGGIAAVFEAYMCKWKMAQAIEADVNTFIVETNGLFDTLFWFLRRTP